MSSAFDLTPCAFSDWQLNLSGHPLTNYWKDVSGILALANALQTTRSLTSLDVRTTALGEQGNEILELAVRGRGDFVLMLN